ncbi:MAG: hypothetical protein IPN86_13815 [Saprospiraceae bacterium]|nr:hypothetical protein [Saprospiraceae bacterium]
MKELTPANTDAVFNGSEPFPHGVTGSKILSVNILIEWTSGSFASPEYGSSANLKYSYYISGSDIIIQNNCPSIGECLINGKQAKILITYKE